MTRLDEIRTRAEDVSASTDFLDVARLAGEDVPALLADVDALADTMRDVLDVTTGWTQALDPKQRLELVDTVVRAALARLEQP